MLLGRGIPAQEEKEKLDAAIARGFDALVALQAADGGWHSEVYGHLKPGVATTAFALRTLARLPEPQRAKYAAHVERGMKFVLAAQGPDGAIGSKGEWVEYPTYSTALAILAWHDLKPAGWEKTIEPWVAYLKAAQHSEDDGCKSGERAYGGWNPEGKHPPGRERRADLAATRHALQALSAAGALDAKTGGRAREFLRASSGGDGGFFFSPTTRDLNKAGSHPYVDPVPGTHINPAAGATMGAPVAYGSATADGALCLRFLAAGSQENKLALDWLLKDDGVEFSPGFGSAKEPAEPTQRWSVALAGYYRSAVAQVMKSSGHASAEWWRKLARTTVALQRPDGTWANPNHMNKEDDPLIATPLALQTLLDCREAMSK